MWTRASIGATRRSSGVLVLPPALIRAPTCTWRAVMIPANAAVAWPNRRRPCSRCRISLPPPGRRPSVAAHNGPLPHHRAGIGRRVCPPPVALSHSGRGARWRRRWPHLAPRAASHRLRTSSPPPMAGSGPPTATLQGTVGHAGSSPGDCRNSTKMPVEKEAGQPPVVATGRPPAGRHREPRKGPRARPPAERQRPEVSNRHTAHTRALRSARAVLSAAVPPIFAPAGFLWWIVGDSWRSHSSPIQGDSFDLRESMRKPL
jgi:hypothetical protein